MQLVHRAVAGTLESSDAFVEIIPAEQGLDIRVQSVVKAQFGDSIEQSVRDVLARFGVDKAAVLVSDRGALDCTIRARVETAVRRAMREKSR